MPGRYRFSMPSHRDRNDPWFRIGLIDVTTTLLIAALCVASFFVYAADQTLLFHLFLIPSENRLTGSVLGGQVWRLVTWPIANEPSIWTAIAIAIFWYFGSQLEAALGRVRYLWLIALTVLIPGLVAVAVDTQVWGIRTLEIAIFVLFVLDNPRMPFFFGLPAWILAVVIVGIDILQLLGNRQTGYLLVYLVALATAALVARCFGMLADYPWLPQIVDRSGSRRRVRQRTGRADASHQTVVSGPWPSAPPTYTPMQDQAEVDRILDKIAAVGMDGLTADEKRRLNEASKRLRKGTN
ncbi:MAG TPA: rhomboid family intramembrane serine protease [Ilumatobacteraceae bacterium]|nr:rhomboid family intramembrane serine protease [Ilumatobacteraceae bacterium]